jgi:hypothetical protein
MGRNIELIRIFGNSEYFSKETGQGSPAVQWYLVICPSGNPGQRVIEAAALGMSANPERTLFAPTLHPVD